MNRYYDKWGSEIVEEIFEIEENGGYVISIELKPFSLLAKVFKFFSFSPVNDLKVEICEDFRQTIDVGLKNKHKYLHFGYFETVKGLKKVKVSLDKKTLQNWDMHLNIKRVYS